MKKLVLFSIIAFGGLVFMNFSRVENQTINPQNNKYEVPENVQAIIDRSCFGCHNSDSKNEKGKKKLSWDLMKKGYKTHKIIAKLGEIEEVLQKNEMPPEKFLAKYPDKKLSDDERNIMIKWAQEMTKKMSE
ncbi:MAG: heme-binding domain-containing protein [Bacteroidales bacterium]|nr:heme-binding domain-containing protein [Bacteroidales bacterium]